MQLLRSFVRFWIDFIIGDAWEVAAGLALTLIAVSVMADRTGGHVSLGFVLLASVLVVSWVALRRTTAG